MKVLAFFDFRRANCHDVIVALKRSFFCEGFARAVFRFCCVKMVPIDRASEELSNGGHIVL